jgi:hypothetical protein
MIRLIVNLFVQRVVGVEKFQMMEYAILIVIVSRVGLMVVIVKYEKLK